MHTFNTKLYNKKIIMISDYVDPSLYNKIELKNEIKLIETFKKQIAVYNINFDYREFKNLHEINLFLEKVDPKETIIFNWCEQVEGIENSGHLVTKLLEEKGLIFTGADSQCLKITGNKKATKETLLKNNLGTPNYSEISGVDEIENINIKFPLIVKLSGMHSSVGINKDNVVNNISELRQVVNRMFEKFKSPLLLEEYIEGVEYTIPVWGNNENAEIISVCEIEFIDKNIGFIQSEEAKFNYYSDEFNNSPCKYFTTEEVTKFKNVFGEIIIKAYNILGFKDYGRFEIRVKDSATYIIDANSNPALCYEDSFFESASLQGYNYGETILKICEYALLRNA